MVQKGGDLLFASGEDRCLEEPIIHIRIGEGLLCQLELGPLTVIDVVEIRIDPGHAVEPEPADDNKNGDNETEGQG